MGWEADKKEAATHKGRVERIAAQAAEGHLAHADGYQGTYDDDPQGEVAGKVEAQQQTREDGTAVAEGTAMALEQELGDGPLKEDTGQCGKFPAVLFRLVVLRRPVQGESFGCGEGSETGNLPSGSAVGGRG